MTYAECSAGLAPSRQEQGELTFSQPWPDYPSRPFASKDKDCEWVAAFVDCYSHRHRHSAIKFLTPHQRHSGAATLICQQRSDVYENARQAHPTRWSRRTPAAGVNQKKCGSTSQQKIRIQLWRYH